MKRLVCSLVPALFAVLASGCSLGPPDCLMFVQVQQAGIHFGASATDQGGDLTVGYKSVDAAIVPVAVKTAQGKTLIQATLPGNNGMTFNDTLSILAHFTMDAGKNGSNPKNMGLGKFFATGMAAQKLAEGFRDQLRAGANAGKGGQAPNGGDTEAPAQ